jgi:hypothetical protein
MVSGTEEDSSGYGVRYHSHQVKQNSTKLR